MQFTTTLVALIAAASANALPESSRLEDRQAGQVTLRFFRNSCSEAPIGNPVTWVQQNDRHCINVTDSVPAGANAFTVTQNTTTRAVTVYANDFCNESSGPHLDIQSPPLPPCYNLGAAVKSIAWRV